MNITVHFYFPLHGILVKTELKYNSKTLTGNNKQNNSCSQGETTHRRWNDGIQYLSLSADCFTFLQSQPAYINQPVLKHLTQAKISTTNINANRMDAQLNDNVQKYAGEGREAPAEIMEWVSHGAFTSIQFSIEVSGRNIEIYDFNSKRMCRWWQVTGDSMELYICRVKTRRETKLPRSIQTNFRGHLIKLL